MSSVYVLAKEAGFVFEGKVEQLQASAAASFPSSADTAVIRVNKVFKSPAALSRYAGQRVTVVLQTPVGLRTDDSAVFFTHGIHYGEGLVVRELGNVPPDITMEDQVNMAAQSESDRELMQRLAQAELVIVGVASAPARLPMESSGASLRISEHDPDWWVTVVEIESVEMGTCTERTTNVLFAHSTDIAWHRSPKILEGDRGVWILHNRDLRGKGMPGKAVIHPFDFQPIDQLARVRILLGRAQ